MNRSKWQNKHAVSYHTVATNFFQDLIQPSTNIHQCEHQDQDQTQDHHQSLCLYPASIIWGLLLFRICQVVKKDGRHDKVTQGSPCTLYALFSDCDTQRISRGSSIVSKLLISLDAVSFPWVRIQPCCPIKGHNLCVEYLMDLSLSHLQKQKRSEIQNSITKYYLKSLHAGLFWMI